jgi:hypothetical protein
MTLDFHVALATTLLHRYAYCYAYFIIIIDRSAMYDQ